MAHRGKRSKRLQLHRLQRQAPEWFASHVENCLKEVAGSSTLIRDPDGDWMFAPNGVPLWVSACGVDGVRVFAFPVVDIRRSLRLLSELNDANAASALPRVYWSNNTVIVEVWIDVNDVDVSSLGSAMGSVVEVSEPLAALVPAVIGGRLALTPCDELTVDGGAA